MKTIAKWQEAVHALARRKGWWDSADLGLEYEGRPAGVPPNIGEKLALVHSEISEALEVYRNSIALDVTWLDDGKPEGFPIELADAVIRIMDLCGYLEIDLEAAIARKHKFNAGRPHRHGGKRA